MRKTFTVGKSDKTIQDSAKTIVGEWKSNLSYNYFHIEGYGRKNLIEDLQDMFKEVFKIEIGFSYLLDKLDKVEKYIVWYQDEEYLKNAIDAIIGDETQSAPEELQDKGDENGQKKQNKLREKNRRSMAVKC